MPGETMVSPGTDLPLGGPDGLQEPRYLTLQTISIAGQGFRRAQNLRRRAARFRRSGAHLGDIGSDFRRSAGGLLDIAGYLLRRGGLLLYGGGDGRRDFRNPADDEADFLHVGHR